MQLEQRERPEYLPAPSTKGNPLKIGNTPPDNAMVFRRHKELANQDGHPYFLPLVDQFLFNEDGSRISGHPAGCIGPRIKGQRTKRKGCCGKVNFCAFCWERKCRLSGLLACLTHIDQPSIVKFSLSLPGSRTKLEALKKARRQLGEFARKNGFQYRTNWIHSFGENPAHGVKGHLDGILSGDDDADLSIFNDHGEAFWPVLKEHFQKPDGGSWDLYMSSRILETRKLQVTARDLVLAGFYAGRPTFPTRRVLAGLYFNGYWNVRLTNINRKTKRPSQIETLRIGDELQPNWNQDDLYWALNQAQEWTAEASRVSSSDRHKLSIRHLDAVIDETRWRRRYRLPGKENLQLANYEVSKGRAADEALLDPDAP